MDARALTVVSLVAGALGCAILWGAGVELPFYPPPGMILGLAGALFVGLVPWRWAPGVGALLGLLMFVGFLAGGGPADLFGQSGAGAAVGQGVRAIGFLSAAIAGTMATFAVQLLHPA